MPATCPTGETSGLHRAQVRTVAMLECYLCCSPGAVLYRPLHDRLYSVSGEWSLRRCTNPACGLVWLDPTPWPEDVGKLYESYFTHPNTPPAWKSRNPVYRAWVMLGGAYRTLVRSTFIGKMRARAEAMYLDTASPGRLLDVGCGDGNAAATLQAKGWEVEGQEIDATAAEFASRTHGFKVHVGPLESLNLPGGAYDAITLSHVIEHTPDPIALLRECRRLLRPGGILIAITPNILSFGHAQFKVNWVALDPPRHLLILSPATAGEMARRAGFARFNVWTTPARAQFAYIASRDIASHGRHLLHKTYSVPQLVRAFWFELRAWHAWRRDPYSGEELVLEAFA
ncbi:MAG: class I SAM-dependent methyltransferase [Anaerolineae bacterium]|nr:class I SAM-dependent methyltransferase [Candidatus Roseilinea sp.]MDW8451129.1 class I SAM-dependent methyltransferase [Anaerolineae bacterium]